MVIVFCGGSDDSFTFLCYRVVLVSLCFLFNGW